MGFGGVRRPIIIATQNITLPPANEWTSWTYRCSRCLLALLQTLTRLVSGLKSNVTFLHSTIVQCWGARAQFLRLPRFCWFNAKLLIGLYALCGLTMRYASLLPGWSHIPYVWQFMFGACWPTVGGNDSALVLSLRGLSFTFPVSLLSPHLRHTALNDI